MSELLPTIQVAFHEALGADASTVSIESTPDDIPGWDSLGHVALASELEKQFNLTFSIDELMSMESVQAIVTTLEGRLADSDGA